MPAKLFAYVNSAAEPLVLERAGPSSPWSFPGEGPADLVQTGPGMYNLVRGGRSYRVLVLKHDREAGTVRLRVGAHCCTVRLGDERSRLMKVLGIDRKSKAGVGDLKAPMPGLVLKVLVKEGDTVQKNDPLLVLEAMKMETEISAPQAGTVDAVHVSPGTAVTSGQVLLEIS